VIVGSGEEGEVAAGGDAEEANFSSIVAEGDGIGAEPTDGGFEVVDLGGEGVFRREAVLDAGYGKAVGDEPTGAGFFVGACAPASAMKVDDEGAVCLEKGEVEVEFEVLVLSGGGVGEVSVGGAVEPGARGV